MPSSSHVLSVDTAAVETADERSRNSIYSCFCAWLISLSAMPSQFVRAVEYDRLNNIPCLCVQIACSVPIHLPVDIWMISTRANASRDAMDTHIVPNM